MKNKIILLIGLVVIVLVGIALFVKPNAFFTNSKLDADVNLTAKDELQISDFQIAGIELLQSITEMKNKLGNPLEEIENKDDKTKIFKYNAIDITCSSITNDVLEIRVKKVGYLTRRGIGINSKKEDVIHRYGSGEIEECLNYQKHFNIKDTEWDHAIQFNIKNKKVSDILIYFATDL